MARNRGGEPGYLHDGASGRQLWNSVAAAVWGGMSVPGVRVAIYRAAAVTWACVPGMEGRRDCGRGSRPGVARARETELPVGPGCQRGEAGTRQGAGAGEAVAG